MFAGLLATPVAPQSMPPSGAPQAVQPKQDSRLVRLQRFLFQNRYPVHRLAGDFIEAADNQELDWRLLPSIAVVESGGGKHCRNNNVFGWANGRARFRSIRDGIHHVAQKLASEKQFRNKDVDGILRAYNPQYRDYARRVKAVMDLIGLPDQLADATN